MSKARGLLDVSLRRAVVFAMAAAAIVAVAGCAGGSDSSKKSKRAPRTSLPSGGTRQILHGSQSGSTLKVVLYGGSGEVKSPRGFDVTPRSGEHFVAVKLGLRNLGTRLYSGEPALTASVTDSTGQVSKALVPKKHGFGKVALKQGEFVLGRLFFEVPEDARLSSFTFKPFGVAGKPAVFEITHGKGGDTAKSTKPLPAGGTQKILRGTQAGSVVKAVVYGSSGANESAVASKPKAGNHFVALKIGLRNMGKRLYSADLPLSAAIMNNKGELFRAVRGPGLGQVDLAKDETAYGRIFFELADDTRVSSFRFRPFGAKGKLAVLAISHGSTKEVEASSKPLPEGGTQKVVQRGRTTLKAVVYGGSGVNEDTFPLKARSGYHIIGVKIGLRNMHGGLYRADPTLSASITDDAGNVSKALRSVGQGVGKVALKEGQTVYGPIYFEVQDKKNPRSFRFRPFGAADKPVAFTIKHGGNQPVGVKLPTETKLGTPEPLPSGGDREVVEHGGTTIKVVSYGGQGDVSDAQFAVKPPAGYHLFALGLGLRNMGPGTYRGTPFLVTSITNNKGQLSRALHSRYGLGKVILEPDRGVYGRLFFQIADHTRLSSVRIRAFGYGPGAKTTVFTVEHGK